MTGEPLLPDSTYGAPPESEAVVVSACLLGHRCRYNAMIRSNHELIAAGARLVPVCPEQQGGLPTPRPEADLVGGDGAAVLDGEARVVDVHGRDVTQEFVRGAEAALATARVVGARRAILKSRSPSCGLGEVSTSWGDRLPGNGVAAELLRRGGLVIETAEFDPEEPGSTSQPG